MPRPEAVYHYTTGSALENILKAGCIETSPSFSKATEKAVVWCSVREDWEPSAAAVHTLPDGRVLRRTVEEIRNQEGGLFRIQLHPEARVFQWEQYVRISRISPRHLRVLHRFAEACGADVRQWRVSFSPISRDLWHAVEARHPATGCWVPYSVRTGADMAALLREIRGCLPLMDRRRRERLARQIERLEDSF